MALSAEKLRILSKVQKCLNLAADTRGDPTTRETAWRQAQALIEKHGLQLDKLMPEAAAPAVPAGPPPLSSPEWKQYWAQRTVSDAMRAGLKVNVLTGNGWFVAG